MIPFFSRMFPGTNLQDLNLDWICRRIMELSKGIIAPWINAQNQHWMVYDTQAETFVDSGVSAAGEGTGPQGEPGKSPVIGTNGNWYTWDPLTQAYADTGVPAQGSDGKSAYAYAQDSGYTGTENQFSKDLAEVVDKLPVESAAYKVTGSESGVSIPSGSYVEIVDSTIFGVVDGLYITADTIPAATLITSAMLTAVNNGGFNALQAEIDKKLETDLKANVPANDSYDYVLASNALYMMLTSGTTAARFSMYLLFSRSNGTVISVPVLESTTLTLESVGDNTLRVTSTATATTSVQLIRYY